MNQNSEFKDKSISMIITLLSVLFIARESWAATCTINTSSVTINAGTIVVQRDVAIGSPITNEITGPLNKIVTCVLPYPSGVDLSIRPVAAISTTFPNYNGNGVFLTGLKGVGATISANSLLDYRNPNTGRGGSYSGSASITTDASEKMITAFGSAAKGQTFNVSISANNLFNLIKTDSTISSGTINVKIAEFFGSSTSTQYTRVPIYLSATVKVSACSVSTPNVNVTLPTVNANSFRGIGNTQGETPFTIGLQCDANARINATMNFTQDSDTTDQSVAAVTGKGSNGVASGVGIQLLYGNTPLKNNTLTFLKTSSGGQELPAGAFTARYFQTKSSVLPGNANAAATMTLTYQ